MRDAIMKNAALKIEDMSCLFDALRPGSTKSLPEALQETIKIAKEKGCGLEELKTGLDSAGIKRSDKFNEWLSNNF